MECALRNSSYYERAYAAYYASVYLLCILPSTTFRNGRGAYYVFVCVLRQPETSERMKKANMKRLVYSPQLPRERARPIYYEVRAGLGLCW